MTDPNALKFVSNAGPIGRLWGDHIGEYVLNVKSFGAVGNNLHDDTPNIQACLDAAFNDTTFQSWSFSNLTKFVYFPPGIYKTTAPLAIRQETHGGMIFGSGMGVSVINNTATTSPNNVVITTDGLLNSTIRDMSLWGVPGNSSICYHFDTVPPTDSGKAKEVCWINMEFRGADTGLSAGTFGQCDSSYVKNCYFHDHAVAGIATNGGNTLQWPVIGGRFENCDTGIKVNAGNVPIISGAYFKNNIQNDIGSFYLMTLTVIGCYSESSPYNGFVATFGTTRIIACEHIGTGAFLVIGGGGVTPNQRNCVILDACTFPNSTVIESGGGNFSRLYHRGCTFNPAIFPGTFGGTVVEGI